MRHELDFHDVTIQGKLYHFQMSKLEAEGFELPVGIFLIVFVDHFGHFVTIPRDENC